ncbi:helix-turn-helix domain-containing protein [Candidatus Jidaibacter acanthamoebae]|nr:helix-turn-helix transcriptional regulator [Candidatus Jidaibacter acanthamoeba]
MINTKYVLENLKEQIKQRMSERNLTASSVEKKSGLKISAVRNILNNKSTNPGMETLVAIAKTLECSVDALLGNQSASSVYASTKNQITRSSEKHIWNFKLYNGTLQAVEKIIAQKHLTLTLEQMLHLIQEVYIYSLNEENPKVDTRFANWMVENIHTQELI